MTCRSYAAGHDAVAAAGAADFGSLLPEGANAPLTPVPNKVGAGVGVAFGDG